MLYAFVSEAKLTKTIKCTARNFEAGEITRDEGQHTTPPKLGSVHTQEPPTTPTLYTYLLATPFS